MDFGLLELNLSINPVKRSVPKQYLQHWIELVAMECLGIELMFPTIIFYNGVSGFATDRLVPWIDIAENDCFIMFALIYFTK